MFNIQIHASGSDGNCVQIDNTIIDIGITKKLGLELLDFDTIDEVFVSHKHGDHIKSGLMNHLIKLNKPLYITTDTNDRFNIESNDNVKFYPFTNTGEKYRINNIVYDVFTLKNGTKLITIPQKHDDIINYAFMFIKDDTTLLYATDLDTLAPSDVGDGIEHLGKFDYILLEGNYDEVYLREYISRIFQMFDINLNPKTVRDDELSKYLSKHSQVLPKVVRQKLYRAVQNFRHLSKVQARAYAKNHLKPNGTYYELHRSSKFYNG